MSNWKMIESQKQKKRMINNFELIFFLQFQLTNSLQELIKVLTSFEFIFFELK